MSNELVTGRFAKVWIGPAVSPAAADTLTEFQALTYTPVGQVTRIGPRGPTSGVVTATVLAENATRKAKGVRNNGNAQIICLPDSSDAGQLALRAAEISNSKYAFKISPNDRPNPTGTDSVQYFRGLVMSAEDSELTNDGVMQVTFGVEIDGDIYRVEAAAGV